MPDLVQHIIPGKPPRRYTIARFVEADGRAPVPPNPSMALMIDGTPAAWFSDDQLADVLGAHVEKAGKHRG